MPEPVDPFEQVPQLQPALLEASQFVRIAFGRAGIKLTAMVLTVEIDERNADGEPLCTSASWPMDDTGKAVDLARQAHTVHKMQHASRQAKGHG